MSDADRFRSAAVIDRVRQAWELAGVRPKIVPSAKVSYTDLFGKVGIVTTTSTSQDGREMVDMELILPENYIEKIGSLSWARGWKRAIVLDAWLAMRYPEVDVFEVRVARPGKGYEVHTNTTYVAVRDGQKIAYGSSPTAARGRAKVADLGRELPGLLQSLGPESPMCAKSRFAEGERWYIVRQKSEDLWQMVTVHQYPDGHLGSPYVCERKSMRSAVSRAWRWMDFDSRFADRVIFNNLPPVPKTKRALKEDEHHQRVMRNITQMDRHGGFATVLL